MVRKLLKFVEFYVPVPKWHQQIIDKDETTDYLFINAPKDIYTVYFNSNMSPYGRNVLNYPLLKF